MSPFEIEILYHNESTRMLKSMDMQFSFEALDVIPMYVNHFDAIHPHYNQGREYTEIFIGGGTVICTLSYSEFIELFKAYNP
jgi:hypothetical protein